MINDVKWFPLIVLSLETTQLLWLTNKIVELSLKGDSIEFLKNTFTLKTTTILSHFIFFT